jgi:hypothetical protein
LRSGLPCSKAVSVVRRSTFLATERGELKAPLNGPALAPAATRARLFFDRVVARLDAVPAWLLLGVLIGASAVVRFVLALNKPAPWIFTDSLVYSELAKSFASSGHFAVRDVHASGGYGIVYSVLLSPAYALFDSVPSAYTAMKAINSVVMSLAAVPTYLLARRLVGRWLPITAAVLALAIPDLAYTGTIMTENAFYPVFAFWCWATVRALEIPTVRRQLLALALLVLAYYARPQAVVLIPALVTSLVLVTLLDVAAARERPLTVPLRRAIRRHATFWALIGGGVALYLVAAAARGRSWRQVLGAYSALADAHYTVSGVGHWFLYNVGELDFALVLIPFAGLLLAVFAGLRPRAAPELRVFAAVAFSASFWLLLSVAAFTSTPFALRILERNTFYVAPLCMAALMVCVGRGLIWAERTAAAAATIVAVGLVCVVQYSNFLGANEPNDTFSLLTLNSVLERRWVSLGQLQAAVVVGATVAGLIFMLTPRRFGFALPLLALLALALANGPVERRIRIASEDSRTGGVQVRRDWLDHAVGTKAQIATLWSNRRSFVSLWDNEFFNRSVGKVYYLVAPPDGLPEEAAFINPVTGALATGAGPVQAKYMLLDSSVVADGTPIAEDPAVGMTLYRLPPGRGVHMRAQIDGIYADAWSSSVVTYRRYECRGGNLTVTLLSDRDLHPRPQKVVALAGGKPVASFVYKPGLEARKMTVPLIPEQGVCTTMFRVPTAIPAQVTGKADPRALGIRFLRFVTTPANG